MRKQYIKNNPLSVFEDYLSHSAFHRLDRELISSADALGRVAADAVFAVLSDPTYNAAAMDGIAVRAVDTASAREREPLTLREGFDFEYVNTGNAVKTCFDAVVMIEDVTDKGNGEVEIIVPAHTWQHIRVKGESIVEGELVLPKGTVIGAVEIGALIASGNTEVLVVKKPIVGIIPTGDEMVSTAAEVTEGKLMESNSKVFAAKIIESGCTPKIYPIVRDDNALLEQAVATAATDCDAVIVNAGSSAGTKDYTVWVLEKLGKVFAHGFAIKPGKPTVLAEVYGKPVLGVPGYPVSAYTVFDLFATRVLARLSGRTLYAPSTVKARLTQQLVGSFKNTEFVRVALGCVDGEWVARALPRGASNITSMVAADGILTLDRLERGLDVGAMVDVALKRSLSEISQRLVVVGSHDLICDLIRDSMPLSSTHVGSTGGILTLLDGGCHVAPIHLLDEQSGEYNVPAVKRYFAGKQMALIRGVGRTQGFLVPCGNPKNISGFTDLTRLKFANRQRGAGTRLLLDYNLKINGIDPANIVGYDHEFTTHTSVASAVASGTADTGLAVYSAAKAAGLDFIPVGRESYDFLTTAERLSDPRVQRFIEVLKSDDFLSRVKDLGGYTVDGIGEVTLVDCR